MLEYSSNLHDLLRKADLLEWDGLNEAVKVLIQERPYARLSLIMSNIRQGLGEGRNPSIEQIEELKRTLKDYFEQEFESPRQVFRILSRFLRFLYRSIPILDLKKDYLKCLERSPRFEKQDLLELFANYETQQLDVKNFSRYRERLEKINPKLTRKFIQEEPFKAFTEGFFLKKNTCVLVLADSGYGKTTFLQKLFYDYARTYPNINLAFVYAGESTTAQIQAISNKAKTILFLDALDEDQQARHNLKERIQQLSQLLDPFHHVLISARVQLFLNREEEWQHFHDLITITIDAIDPGSYLKKRFKQKTAIYQAAEKLVNSNEELFKRPLFLSWIEDLLFWGTERPLKYSSEIYRILADRWAVREEAKVEAQNFQGRNYRYRLLGFSQALAIHLYRQQTNQINPETIAQISEDYEIGELNARDRSFLARDRKTDTWAFTHQSFFDYFLARALFFGRLREEEFDFKAYPATADLYNEMCWLLLSDQNKVKEHHGHFVDERITLRYNWVLRTLCFARTGNTSLPMYWKDFIASFSRELENLPNTLLPFGEDKLPNNLPAKLQSPHYLLEDYRDFLTILDEKKTLNDELSLYTTQFLQEELFQRLLQLNGQQDWIKQGVLQLHVSLTDQLSWPSQLPALTSFGDTLAQLLQNSPVLRNAWGQLRTLSLNGFGLRTIPAALLHLKELRSLDLSYNWIDEDDSLLKKLLRLPELLELRLEGNPIVHDWSGESDLRALRERYLFPPEMVWVEGGSFEMGDDGPLIQKYFLKDSITGIISEICNDDEKPVHKVNLTGFWMATHPVTIGEFRCFIEETGYQTQAEIEESYSIYTHAVYSEGKNWRYDTKGALQNNDRHPVIYVCWYDALKYCNWLSQKRGFDSVYSIHEYYRPIPGEPNHATLEKKVQFNRTSNGYRLPTEAEWEYAARERGRRVRYGNGMNIANPMQMNFFSELETDYSISGSHRNALVVSDAFAPNSLGLYNMSGNIYEWCWDAYNHYDNKVVENLYTTLEVDSPIDPYRVLRGGSWGSNAKECRSTNRAHQPPITYSQYEGFRIVLGASLHF